MTLRRLSYLIRIWKRTDQGLARSRSSDRASTGYRTAFPLANSSMFIYPLRNHPVRGVTPLGRVIIANRDYQEKPTVGSSRPNAGRPRIICILPAFNEVGKVGCVVTKVAATNQVDKIVVIDDCSTDRTSQEAAEAGAHVIRHETNLGVGAAIRTGLSFGRHNDFDIGVILSSDNQHEPTELSSVLDPIIRGEAHFVQGSRRLEGGRTVNAPTIREFSTRVYSAVFSVITGSTITDGTNGFRALSLDILDDNGINLEQEWLNTYELEPYLLYKAVRSRDCRVTEVPITIYYHDEYQQYSKMKPFRDWWRIFRPLVLLGLGIRR